MTPRLAVIIPVYNHERTILSVVKRALGMGYPVIVVDDGSTDDTRRIVAGIEGVRKIRHPKNLGKGAALVSGFRAAARIADWAVTLDADEQHLPEEIAHFAEKACTGGRAIWVGKRQGMAAAPWTSRFGAGFSNFWIWVSGGPWLSDSQSGYRLYPLPQTLQLPVVSGRYQYEIEVLVQAARAGMIISEIPVRVIYDPPGGRISHFMPMKDFLRNTWTFTRLIFRRIISPRLWLYRNGKNGGRGVK
jgi:glycosyltransferase involved in cell wall biosynthesis